MDGYHFNNIINNIKITITHIGDNKNLQFFKKMDIFYVMNLSMKCYFKLFLTL
jgi:hypothetical protein